MRGAAGLPSTVVPETIALLRMAHVPHARHEHRHGSDDRDESELGPGGPGHDPEVWEKDRTLGVRPFRVVR